MSKGVLIYAFNSNFDYIKSAEFAAKQVKKFLNLPVTLVTNTEVDSEYFDNVIIFEDATSTPRQYRTDDGQVLHTKWLNSNRTSAYNVSPYDQTLLIDADYFMFNDSLKCMFDTDSEFACFNKINDVTGEEKDLIRLSEISIPMQWATVIYFTKSDFANAVFDFMEIIKKNWDYYSLLYSFRSGTYRNDFALSIALQTLSGYSTQNFNKLPGKLHTLFSHVSVSRVSEGEVVFAWNNQLSKVVNTNLHCMNKLAVDKFYE